MCSLHVHSAPQFVLQNLPYTLLINYRCYVHSLKTVNNAVVSPCLDANNRLWVKRVSFHNRG